MKPGRIAAVPAAGVVCAAGGMMVALTWRSDPARFALVLGGWSVACAGALLAATGRDEPILAEDAAALAPSRRGWLAALALLATAFALTCVDVARIPAPLHNDEMACALQARLFLSRPEPLLFATGWSDCPNLGFFLQSLPMRLFGDDLFGARMGSVVAGLLALVGVYLLVRRLAGERVALLLLALTVPYHWQLHLSRTAFTYVWAMSATAWTLYLYSRALATGRWRWYAGAGLAAAIAFQTYYSARIVLLIVPAWAAALWISDRRRGAAIARGLAITALTAGFALLPLALWYAAFPDKLLTRTRSVFVFNPVASPHIDSVLGDHRWQSVMDFQLRRIAGFLPLGRDGSQQYGFRGPFLPPVLWLPFVAGAALSLSRIRQPVQQLFWIWWLLTMVLGGVLTLDPPFSPRLAVICPIVYFLPALGLAESLRWAGRRRAAARLATAVLVAALVAVSAAWNLRAYFRNYPVLMPGERRDRIARLLEGHGEVRTAINFFPEAEVFGHESYGFLAPHVIGLNWTGDDRTGALGGEPGTLIALPALLVAPPHAFEHGPPLGDFPALHGVTIAAQGRAPDFAWWIVR